MDLEVRAKNIEITKDLNEYILKRMERIGRCLGSDAEGKIEFSKVSAKSQQDRIVVQMTININGVILRAQERGPNILPAIDSVADIMVRRVNRYRGKSRKGQSSAKSGRRVSIRKDSDVRQEDEQEEPLPELGDIVRTKRFIIKPMSVEEAITQMELLGHSFFLFLNGVSGQYNVVYRRRDGDYGIIEPELV